MTEPTQALSTFTARAGALPDVGDMVTVTYRDDSGTQRTFHGCMGEQLKALTAGDSRGEFRHHWHKGTTAARRWAVVHHTIEHQQVRWGMKFRGRDFEYDLEGLAVCVESENVTIVPITDAGRTWLREHENATEKRDRLLARFADFDAAASAELSAVIAELVQDARDEIEAELRNEDD